MGLFSKKKVQIQEEPKEERGGSFALPYSSGSSVGSNSALKLSTVYRCVEVISSSVAQLPIDLYTVDKDGYKTKDMEHSVAFLLATEPNQ